jgi:hypothetical protein
MEVIKMKSFSELIKCETFEERLDYLMIGSVVGQETFGYSRPLNQQLYTSSRWKRVRDKILIRDNGEDLGLIPIKNKVIIHHINPITIEDIEYNRSILFDPDNLICTSQSTHNTIHFGDKKQLQKEWKPREKHDTIPWK